MLWRLALRPDRRLAVAAAGICMAILLPVAGTLLLQGLEPNVRAEEGWIASAPDASAFASDRVPAGAVRAVLQWHVAGAGGQGGLWVGAFVQGGPAVGAGEVLPMPGADPALVAARFPGWTILPAPEGTPPLPLVPGRGVVVAGLEEVDGAVAWLDRPVPGLGVRPARGVDAFESASIGSLRSNVVWLVAASLPAVAAVAFTFVSLEADRSARTSATFAALGHPQMGRLVMLARVTMAVALGTVLASLIGFILWQWGPAGFHPRDTRKFGLALAILVPGATAVLAGALTLGRPLRSGTAQLRSPSPDESPPERRIPWLPVALRPLLLGHQVVLLFLVAGLLFTADVGLPLAAAQVPAALAGEPGEWIRGAETGLVLGGATAAAATVLAHDPAIDAAVAEVLVPTLLGDTPAVLRGGDWTGLARYHELHGGTAPGPDEVTLSTRLADRLHVVAGDTVFVQASHRPLVVPLRVAGTYSAHGLLGDEGILHASTAQDLAGLDAGQATLVRVRPDSLAALAVLQRTEARIEVLGLSTTPATPAAGSVFRIDAVVADLGSGAGSRDLTFRVGGVPVHQETVALQGYETRTVSTFAIAPEGPFRVEVNPVEDRDGGAASVRLEAPLAFADTPAAVRLLQTGQPVADRTVSAYASLADAASSAPVATAMATATTDADGTALLSLPAGNYTVVAEGAASSLLVSPASFRDRAVLTIDRVWGTPGTPTVGSSVTLHASVINLGGVAGDGDYEFMAGSTRYALRYVHLGPGERTEVDAAFRLDLRHVLVRVNDQSLAIDGRIESAAPVLLTDPDIRSSGSLQSDVADHVLGNAQRALASLMLVALASSLTVVYLATERTLRGRVQVARVLRALGQDLAAVRRRAAWEAVGLTAVAFLGAALSMKLLLAVLRLAGAPVVFAHVLPDPYGLLLTTQALAAFCATAALAAYLAAGAVLREAR